MWQRSVIPGLVALVYAGLLLLTGALGGLQAVLFLFAPPWLTGLPLLLVAGYGVGGLAAILGRTWGRGLTGVIAAGQLVLCSLAALLLLLIERDVGALLSFGPSPVDTLLLFVPPVLIAFSATGRPGPAQRQQDRVAGGIALGLLLAFFWYSVPPAFHRIAVDGLEFCIPSAYARQDGRLLHVPDSLLSEQVPGYTSGAGADIVIYGALYSRSQFDPVLQAAALWKAGAAAPGTAVEADPLFPGYRIRQHRGPDAPWHLVASAPPAAPEGEPPEDWYIGWCHGTDPGTGFCQLYIAREDVIYDHPVHYTNLHLHREIRTVIDAMLTEWQLGCD